VIVLSGGNVDAELLARLISPGLIAARSKIQL
jgi:hypothetical protein